MELNENADIDTSQIEDRRGSGGGGGFGGLPIPIGGGGIVGIIIFLVLAVAGGYFGVNTLGGDDSGSSGDNSNIQKTCSNKAEALKQLECRNTLYVNSIQAFWKQATPKYYGKPYQPALTVFFSDRVSTGCGAADSGVGPFYCPADDKVYIDLTFYQLLAKQLGAPGEFAQPYVLAHEYGHHIQDITGIEAKMRQQQKGASSKQKNLLSVKLELQADCLAGAWAKGASDTTSTNGQRIFKSLTSQDIEEGIQTAGQIGDDVLQKRSGNTINPAEFTHGTAADRQKWFAAGYNSGSPDTCDTFAPGAVNAGA